MNPISGVLELIEAESLSLETTPAGPIAATRRPALPNRIAIIGNYLPRHGGIATFTTDLCDAIHADRKRQQLRARHGAWWDANKIGMSPPPIETSRGWLMIYHGVRGTPSRSYLINTFKRHEQLKLMANGVNREHGHYRRPVGGSRTVVSSEATGRWTRATVAGHACGFERSILGFTHGCSLARSAVSLSALSNLSSTIPTLAAQRAADAFAAKTGRGLTRPRKARSERILHRRQLQRREKRGSGVGPTKRGKGSKIMAIADGHGLPLAVHVASASPHETKLVEPTLDQRFLAETPERMIGDRAYDSDPLDQRIQRTLRRATHRASQICARRSRNARRSPPAPLPSSLENRAPVRLAS